jgi:hypothetical protein
MRPVRSCTVFRDTARVGDDGRAGAAQPQILVYVPVTTEYVVPGDLAEFSEGA